MSLTLPQYVKSDLIAELTAAGGVVRGNAVKCPWHDDRQASGHLSQNTEGKWRYKCHAPGCPAAAEHPLDLWDIRAMVTGKPLDEILRDASPPLSFRPERNPVKVYSLADFRGWHKWEATYIYTNPATGAADLVIVRYTKRGDTKKSFIQAKPHGDGFSLGGITEGPWPLYNRGRVASAEYVVVVEGEKCVHALHKLGIVAATSPGGANSAERADWTPLAGKECYLWPDNDTGGQAYMDDVADILGKLDPPAKLYRVNVEALELPDKGDVVDYLKSLADGRVDFQQMAIKDVLGDARQIGGDGLRGMIDAIIAGERDVLETPFDALDFWTQMLMPGRVTVLCGPTGSSKSFWLTQLVVFLHRAGHKLALYELEDDVELHLWRILAQLEGDSNLARTLWVKYNGQEAHAANNRQTAMLEEIKARMTDAPEKPPTYDALLAWLEAKAAEGCELAAIDPITAAESNREPWVADHDFVLRVKSLARRTGLRVLLVTHPRTGHGAKPGVDSVAGGAAYRRFPHTVLWLQKLDEDEDATIKTKLGPHDEMINRKLHLIKVRNGPGQGLSVGFWFDMNTLRFEELGVIATKKKGRA